MKTLYSRSTERWGGNEGNEIIIEGPDVINTAVLESNVSLLIEVVILIHSIWSIFGKGYKKTTVKPNEENVYEKMTSSNMP